MAAAGPRLRFLCGEYLSMLLGCTVGTRPGPFLAPFLGPLWPDLGSCLLQFIVCLVGFISDPCLLGLFPPVDK